MFEHFEKPTQIYLCTKLFSNITSNLICADTFSCTFRPFCKFQLVAILPSSGLGQSMIIGIFLCLYFAYYCGFRCVIKIIYFIYVIMNIFSFVNTSIKIVVNKTFKKIDVYILCLTNAPAFDYLPGN